MRNTFQFLRMRLFRLLKMDYTVDCEEAERDSELQKVIRKAVEATLVSENVIRPVYVSVTICTPEHIRSLNRDFREKDTETDVLSFPLWDREEAPADGILELGDIVISYARAGEQAKELGHSLHREVAFLAIHSTLHLLGYDHELSQEDEEDMCTRQNRIIRMLRLEPAKAIRKDKEER